MEFFATCGRGLERMLGDELRRLGVHGVRPLSSGVTFSGDLRDAYAALLWSRIASRVLLTLARVSARDADDLYNSVLSVDWSEHIAPGKTIAIDARGVTDQLRDTRFTGLRVKDAICDQFRERTGARPDVDPRNPDVLVNVVLHSGKATLSIDLSGSALERRGYRPNSKPQGAPIRENLAAALLLAAGWGTAFAGGLVDPRCGGGIVAVEAAMIAADVAPGLTRSRWGFDGWKGHDEELWSALIDEADERAAADRGGIAPIFAADSDAACLAYARDCAKRAGVADRIVFTASPDELPKLADAQASGGILATVVGDAPMAQLPALYAQLASIARADAGISKLALLAPRQQASVLLGMDASFDVDVRNGALDASLAVYDCTPAAPATISVRDKRIEVADEAAQQFASRLNKVYKARRKWAAGNKVDAYRVYDADLPDYKLAIDLYQGAGPDEGKRRVHVAEYAAPKEIDPAKATRRLADALRIIPAVLEVDPCDVHVKRRLRAKGGSQYAQDGQVAQHERFITKENGLSFEVDLSDYLDTGLFLDHRDTRRLIAMLSRGKSFLNLFAYTGTASVYAAAGGAKFTTTVDISNTYQRWTRRNFELNGLMNEHQELVRADVLQWVSEMRHSRMRWDLVFVDPPTFSNSSKMGSRSWDVQRDHGELLIDVSRLLTRNGAAIFSCNLKKFELNTELLAKAGVRVQDITGKTIPQDFERNPHVHHCYLLKRA